MYGVKNMNEMKRGFTIVELVVVVAVIAILAAISIVGYGAWREGTELSVLTSDLTGAATAMEGNANFQTSYPASVDTVFMPSKGSVVAGGAIGSNNYCVSIARNDASMFTTKAKIKLPGTCPLVYIDPSKSASYSGSGTSINDLSGNANNAVMRKGTTEGVQGPIFVSSEAGGVFQFDGVSDTYRVVNQITSTPNMTWAACAKTITSKNNFNMFMGKNQPYFGSHTNGTSVIFSNRIGGTQRTITSPSPAIPLNTWNCYVFTTFYDGTNTTMTIYVNGAYRNAGTFAGVTTNANVPFVVGDGQVSSSAMWYPFEGMVGDVAVYDRTFSEEEAKAMFQMLRSKYGI